MKKSLLSLIFIGLTCYSHAQVGVWTNNPRTTLDVVKSTTNPTTTPDGVRAPNITKTELANKTATTYTNTQNGVIVYVTDVSGGTTGTSLSQVENVNMPGLYYFDGPTLKWIYLGSNPVMTNFRSTAYQALDLAATTDQTITFTAAESLVNLASVFDDDKDEFTINYDGIYQLSAFIGFNANQPNFTDPRDFVAVNLKILKANAATPTAFTSITGIRAVFAGITAGTGTAIQIPTTVLPLKAGDKIKFVIQRPALTIGTSPNNKSNSNFGDFGAGNGHINLPGGQTYTKSLTILKVK